jgi:CBS domain-containing protein/anti-sigma regulatory factor (Ser/Thr protein kinase)
MESIPIDTDGGPQVVLELIYRLKVRDVMTTDVVSLPPTATLREAQIIMRDRGITGVPIVENERLVGIVSIGDIIEALDGGWIGDAATRRMTEAVIVLEADMPINFAITYLNRYGYRRFPALDKNGQLVGIVTAADIIRALLVEMNREVERLEEGLARRRKSEVTGIGIPGTGVAGAGGSGAASGVVDPGLRDTADGSQDAGADKPPADLVFQSRKFDFETAGKASGELKKALKVLGVEPATIRRAAVASYELEMNQVIHSDGGTMSFHIGEGCLEIVAADQGPGIPDLEAALTEGFSTANEWIRSLGFGAGLGLPNARRSSDEFSLDSGPRRGTTVRALIRY